MISSERLRTTLTVFLSSGQNVRLRVGPFHPATVEWDGAGLSLWIIESTYLSTYGVLGKGWLFPEGMSRPGNELDPDRCHSVLPCAHHPTSIDARLWSCAICCDEVGQRNLFRVRLLNPLESYTAKMHSNLTRPKMAFSVEVPSTRTCNSDFICRSYLDQSSLIRTENRSGLFLQWST